jgi:hypothetical protein
MATAARIAGHPGIVTVDKAVDQKHFSVNIFPQQEPQNSWRGRLGPYFVFSQTTLK